MFGYPIFSLLIIAKEVINCFFRNRGKKWSVSERFGEKYMNVILYPGETTDLTLASLVQISSGTERVFCLQMMYKKYSSGEV